MKITTPPILEWIVAGCLGGATLLLAGGCANDKRPRNSPSRRSRWLNLPGSRRWANWCLTAMRMLSMPLLAAVKAQDHEQVHRLLGPAWKELVSGDKVEDAEDFKDFAAVLPNICELRRRMIRRHCFVSGATIGYLRFQS